MALHRQGDEFSERDLFGLMLMGVLATGARVKRLASRRARRTEAFDEVRDGATVDLLLGLIAVYDRLRVAIAAEPRPVAADPESRARPSVRTLLR